MVAFPPSSASGSSLVARAAGATAGKPGSASQSSRSPRVYAKCGCLPPRWIGKDSSDNKPAWT
jgi:hypothetical protein